MESQKRIMIFILREVKVLQRPQRHRVQIFISMKTMSLCLHSFLFSADSQKLLRYLIS
jgi:hypothetical protein